ncbi:Uroporphyrinogen-III methyltransferase / Uroporphyrinogen-III synthase [Actinomycetales bacterium JB111]|nr:Uroporphyrinogen-III methyltransferase / Uroporphyrinogen-III synthase [Actinomycetales bacterium JB111]
MLVPHERFAPAMRATGLVPVVVPLTRTVGLPVDREDIDPACTSWVVVTSARTVRALVGAAPDGDGATDDVASPTASSGGDAFDDKTPPAAAPGDEASRSTSSRDEARAAGWPAAVAAAQAGGTRVAAVGAATAAALADVGVTADLLSPDGTMAGIVAAIGSAPGRPGATDLSDGPAPAPGTVLLPASALADPAGRAALTDNGWHVRSVPVYTTAQTDDPAAVTAATTPWPDAVALTSPSNLRALVAIAGPPPAGCALVAIGSTTAEAIRSEGLPVAAEAQAPTPAALAAAAAAATTARATGPVADATPGADPTATATSTPTSTATQTTRAADRATRTPGPDSGVGGRRRT